MVRSRVLIVEDDPIQRGELARYTSELGFVTLTASDGLEALDRMRDQAVNVVVTDLAMPRLEGRGLIMAIRQRQAATEIPIMVVTGDVSRSTKIKLLQMGADDFIAKPVHRIEFQVRLASLVRKSEMMFDLVLVMEERDRALLELEERHRELRALTDGLVAALERANMVNDLETGNHIRRVAAYSRMLAEARGCPTDYVEQIERYSGLHDVGKVGIRDAILKNPGRFTPDEYEEMKTHTIIGFELLKAANLPPQAANIALHHHERWDGRGYPYGIREDRIPLEARMVSVADVYDALRSRRCYKDALAHENSRRLMEEAAGLQFDPDLVETFFANEDNILTIAQRFSDEACA